MKDMIDIKITFFGTFRRFDPIAPVSLQLPSGCDRQAVKAALWEMMRKFDPDLKLEGLFSISVLANDASIIDQDYRFTHAQTLALIPPVSGG